MPRTEQLNIYLLKPSIAGWPDAVRPIQGNLTYTQVVLPNTFPAGSALLVRSTPPHPPGWLRYFPAPTQAAAGGLVAASSGAMLLLNVQGRWFAVSFGTGWHLLKKDAFVRSFGLRAALSLVKGNTLKAVDVSTYENFAKHRRVSTSKGTTIDSFDIEGQLDLLRGVVGECDHPSWASQIGGKDACVVWTKKTFDQIPKLCKFLLAAYGSGRVSKRYPVVNNVAEVRDPSEEARLDGLLDAAIAGNPNHDISIAPPEVIDWQDVQAFSLDHANAPAPAVGFSFADIRTMFHPVVPTCADMKSVTVGTVTPAGNAGLQSWSLHDCVVTEIDDPMNGAVKCILMAGQWYVVAASFVADVNARLAAIPQHAQALPAATATETEGLYNARFAGATPLTHALLDKKNISYGGGNSRIEVCDVITSGSVLYHVKDYHGSATLSHLFAQGTVSARLLLEQEFRQKIVDKYPALPGNVIQAAAIDPSTFEVVYAIICDVTRLLPGGLPFFSKVRLVESARELRQIGFRNVTVAKISRP